MLATIVNVSAKELFEPVYFNVMHYTSRIPELKLSRCPYDLFSVDLTTNLETQWFRGPYEVSDSIGPGSNPDRDKFLFCVYTGRTYIMNNCSTIYQRRGSTVGYSGGVQSLGSQEFTSSP